MATRPQRDSARDPFERAHSLFGEMLAWLEASAHDADHRVLEEGLRERGNEILRAAYQGHLDQRHRREREALRAAPPDGIEVRTRKRSLETLFGRVQVRRAARSPRRVRPRIEGAPSPRRGVRRQGAARDAAMPADGRLALPRQIYSAPLQEQAMLNVVGASYASVGESIDRQTAGHIPHRPLLQLARCCAQDVDAFYAQRSPPTLVDESSPTRLLEVMSGDGKGVRMRPEGLREETRKLAEQQAASAIKGDPMAQRQARSHDRRMAVVTANWEQEPRVRAPEDILRDLTAPRTGKPRKKQREEGPRKDLPRPRNKRVRASLEHGSRARIEEVFAEADRRDPSRVRPRVMLVDGSISQLLHVTETAAKLGISVTIIVDVIHVLHYLWKLSKQLSTGDDGVRETWVREHLMRLMTRPAHLVLSGLRQSATLLKLRGDAREAVDDAVGYLERNSAHLDYGAYLRAGMPIATGVIEGACRHLVQDRMGITGACWGLDGGEAVLKLRSVWTSGDWDPYWNFHLQQEHRRNYPVAQAA
jgi:hypothetical protein